MYQSDCTARTWGTVNRRAAPKPAQIGGYGSCFVPDKKTIKRNDLMNLYESRMERRTLVA